MTHVTPAVRAVCVTFLEAEGSVCEQQTGASNIFQYENSDLDPHVFVRMPRHLFLHVACGDFIL